VSKLLDRLRRAALSRAAAPRPDKTTLLTHALQRAHQEREQVRAVGDRVVDLQCEAIRSAARAESELDAEHEALALARSHRLAREAADARAQADRRGEAAALSRADAERRAAEEAQKRAEAERRAVRAAQARLNAEERALATESARAQAEEEAVAQARARAEAEEKLHAQTLRRIESTERARRAADERARADQEAHALHLSVEEARRRHTPPPRRLPSALAALGVAALIFAAVILAWHRMPGPPIAKPTPDTFKLDKTLSAK
jgi:hypothetical protein